MKILPLVLLLPVVASTQTVDPVISRDYLDRIKDTRQKVFYTDTTNSAKNALLQLSNNYYGYPIQKILVKNGYLTIRRAYTRSLFLSGNFSSTIAVKTINHLPALQNDYVQGRADNGSLIWRGPETNEQFSWGPTINSLEYDGNNYSYDANGKLVAVGTGNGKEAAAYSNSIFRTGSLLSRSLVLQARYAAKAVYTTKIKIGQSDEQTVIKRNKNAATNFSISEDASLRGATLNASFTNSKDRFSNSNRNGFLNRVYQNSLLTPISFDNSQGPVLANDQRRYSNTADNPYFLLEDNGNFFSRSHNIGSLTAEKKFSGARFKIIQSTEKTKERTDESYKPATAFFPAGIFVNRKKTDASYYFNTSGSVDVRYGGGNIRSTVNFNYAFTRSGSRIDYSNTFHRYRRSAHDVNVNYLTTFNLNNIDAGIRAGNKFYASNTTLQNDFFLPEASAYVWFNNIFNANGLFLKLASNYFQFNSEVPVSTSFSSYSLTRLSAGEAFKFFPLDEVRSFDDLSPVRHKEWTARAELTYKNKISLAAEVFDRETNDDVFPFYDNNAMVLKNIADHRNTGVEIIATYYSRAKRWTTNHSISVSTYNDVVRNVRNGFDFTPVAGFANVHKAIVNGSPLGVIVGNRFLRDAKNNIIIGNNGFPLVDPGNYVIGDPTPDLILKTSHTVNWKNFSLNVDFEWKKGGDMWNGTQAILDYFGRSEKSASLRLTADHIFPGVTADGHVNTTPVSFYDANLPVEENRWVRYGYSGVAEEYIQKASYIRINNLAVNYKLSARKYIQTVAFTLYANNLLVWSAYKGADQNQLLYDQSNASGLDFFNIPSAKSYGLNVSIQF